MHIAGGLPGVHLVGLPDAEVREARDRVRAALQNSQFEFPARRVTVNLAPADLPKESGRFDLPIALGILAATGQIPATQLARLRVRRRTGADRRTAPGARRAGHGAAPRAATAAHSCCPQRRAAEAALVHGATVYGAPTLLEYARTSPEARRCARVAQRCRRLRAAVPDLADVRGQARRSARSRSPLPAAHSAC